MANKIRYLFKEVDRSGQRVGCGTYGLTPELWDRPEMTSDEARTCLSVAYGIPVERLVLVRTEEK